MAEQVKKPLKITETVLRDAHQSLIATRMTTEQMLPIVDKMLHSDSLRKIHGKDFVSLEMDSRILSFRCFSEDRIY